MKSQSLLLLTVGFLLAADAPDGETAKKELKKLEGTWIVVSVERGGKKVVPDLKDEKYTFKAPQMIIRGKRGATVEDATYKIRIDPTKTPKTIDLTVSGGALNGTTLRGIYRLEGNSLTIYTAFPGEALPTKLESKPDSRSSLVTLKREKRKADK